MSRGSRPPFDPLDLAIDRLNATVSGGDAPVVRVRRPNPERTSGSALDDLVGLLNGVLAEDFGSYVPEDEVALAAVEVDEEPLQSELRSSFADRALSVSDGETEEPSASSAALLDALQALGTIDIVADGGPVGLTATPQDASGEPDGDLDALVQVLNGVLQAKSRPPPPLPSEAPEFTIDAPHSLVPPPSMDAPRRPTVVDVADLAPPSVPQAWLPMSSAARVHSLPPTADLPAHSEPPPQALSSAPVMGPPPPVMGPPPPVMGPPPPVMGPPPPVMGPPPPVMGPPPPVMGPPPPVMGPPPPVMGPPPPVMGLPPPVMGPPPPVMGPPPPVMDSRPSLSALGPPASLSSAPPGADLPLPVVPVGPPTSEPSEADRLRALGPPPVSLPTTEADRLRALGPPPVEDSEPTRDLDLREEAILRGFVPPKSLPVVQAPSPWTDPPIEKVSAVEAAQLPSQDPGPKADVHPFPGAKPTGLPPPPVPFMSESDLGIAPPPPVADLPFERRPAKSGSPSLGARKRPSWLVVAGLPSDAPSSDLPEIRLGSGTLLPPPPVVDVGGQRPTRFTLDPTTGARPTGTWAPEAWAMREASAARVMQSLKSVVSSWAEGEVMAQTAARRIAMLSRPPVATQDRLRDVLLVVDAEADTYPEMLSSLARPVMTATSSAQAEQIIAQHQVSAVVLSLTLPDSDGRQLLRALSASPVTAVIPVIVVSDIDNNNVRAECECLGARAFLPKPLDPETLCRAIQKQMVTASIAPRALHLDSATGLLNRAALQDAYRLIQQIPQPSRPTEHVLALVHVDVPDQADNFEDQVTIAHAVEEAGQLLLTTLRGSDIIARWELNQLVVLLPWTVGPNAAVAGFERVLSRWNREHLSGPLKDALSIGVVDLNDGSPLEDGVERARKIANMAFSQGGGRVISWEEASPRGVQRVVLAEDDPTVAALIRHRLRLEGFEVEWYPDGLAALESITADRPAAVISDYKLPGIDGFELVRRLRKKPETARVPFVLMTSLASEENVLRGFDAGVDDFLDKPFSPRELVARMTRLIRSR